MQKDWKGRVVVITGGGAGIGRSIAVKLAGEGMRIILFGGNRISMMEETVRLVREAGGECELIPGNLTDRDWLRSACEELSRRDIDVLVNNAGVAQNCSVSDVTEEFYDKVMDINVRAPFFLTQALLPRLRASERGTVINISSVVGHLGYSMQSIYTASKHAILGFTKSLAAEEYANGLRVHAICPGGVYTDMVKLSRPDLTSDGMTLPEDIAEIVWFFLYMRGNAVVDEIIVHRANKQPFLT